MLEKCRFPLRHESSTTFRLQILDLASALSAGVTPVVTGYDRRWCRPPARIAAGNGGRSMRKKRCGHTCGRSRSLVRLRAVGVAPRIVLLRKPSVGCGSGSDGRSSSPGPRGERERRILQLRRPLRTGIMIGLERYVVRIAQVAQEGMNRIEY